MELKVWVEGIQRIVCGVTDKTTCQDVVYALAHATGKTGRFTLIERWRNNERLLAPQEHPLKVLQKWGEYAQDVQFILQRSALDKANNPHQVAPLSPQPTRSKFPTTSTKAQSAEPPAVWKPPPPAASYPGNGVRSKEGGGARLSPDSGRGSDRTGSDSSNSYPDHNRPSHNGYNIPKSSSASQMPSSGGLQQQEQTATYGFTKQQSMPALRPPAYRQPPPGPARNSSPAEPPPYREPPPPGSVRPPHYSPPPTHRSTHLSRHPSRSSLGGSRGNNSGGFPQHHGLPYRQQQSSIQPPTQPPQPPQPSFTNYQGFPASSSSTDFSELMNLVTAQQSTLQNQHSDMKQCDAEVNFLEGQIGLPPISSSSSTSNSNSRSYVQPGSQLEMVLAEARRLEEAAHRNEDELRQLVLEQRGNQTPSENLLESSEDPNLRAEIMQLKHRLAGTDQELQKTNLTLRRLGDEMRSMSLEKSRQREAELAQEIERLQMEIKTLQKNSEEAANVNQQLSKEVKDVEDQISQRKAEVEKLIQEMREVNMESLAISPPEESQQFLDGPPKQPGQARKMMGSPRQLENAVPTSKNPHGVWV